MSVVNSFAAIKICFFDVLGFSVAATNNGRDRSHDLESSQEKEASTVLVYFPISLTRACFEPH